MYFKNIFFSIFIYYSLRISKSMLKLLFLIILFKQLNTQGSKNLLINGDFSYDKFLSGESHIATYNVTGWTSIYYFQFWNASAYNINWPNSRQMVQVAIPAYETLSQTFQSKSWDYYNLSFEYAAHPAGFSQGLYNTIRVFVKWNGALVQQLFLSDTLINKKTIKLMSNATTNKIEFIPSELGNAGAFGMGFTSIEIIGYCNIDRTYSQAEGKCIWNPIPHCLQFEQISGNCTVCQNMFIPASKTCKCQPKFYLSEDTCKPCLLPCEQCQGSPRNCLSCANFYTFQENQCKIAETLTQIAISIVSLPGFQFLSIGQLLIGNLNQFWPYYSHHRQYGQQTDEALTFIHTIQNNKWFIMSLDKKIEFNFQSLNFSSYGKYSNQNFLRKQNRTSYFWDGAFQILFFTSPTMLLMFLLLMGIFYLTYKYRISRQFRLYSLLLTIYIILFEGDISFLSFVSFSNSMNLFCFKFQDKMGHVFSIFVLFLLTFFCVGGFLLSKILYKTLAKYYIENFTLKLQSFIFLMFLCIKQLITGALNAFLATKYEILIISLGSIEIVMIFGLFYFQKRHKCYRIQSFMYISMIKSILMSFFNLFLWIDWKHRNKQQTEKQVKDLLDQSCKVLIIIIIGTGVFQIISSYFSGQKASNNKIQSEDLTKIYVQDFKEPKILQKKQNIINNFYDNGQSCLQQLPLKLKNNIKGKQIVQRNALKLFVIWLQNQQQDIQIIQLYKK